MLSYSKTVIIGKTSGPFRSGSEPYPWIMFTVDVGAFLWDRFGHRKGVIVHHCVVVHGRGNVDSVRREYRSGRTVAVEGQEVPMAFVAADAGLPGLAVFASLLQWDELPKKEENNG